MTNNTSKIDELIKTKNPFAGHFVVKSQQIWGKSFPDVHSINAHASNAVFDAISKVNQGHLQTTSITIVAEKGLGKSHIISRIRHQLQTREDSLFIYMSKYDNLNQIQNQFLQSVTSSLRAFSRPNVMQWQEIAAELINEGMQWKYTTDQYINKILPTLLNKHSHKVVGDLRNRIEQKKANITNPYIIQAILWTLSKDHANFSNYWLSGLALPEEHAQLMGLPNFNNQDRESEALKNARQILDIISDYKVPVICFDELDIADIADNGFTAAQVIANLAKDLYNNLQKGVLLLAMYPETWRDQIRTLPQAEAVIDRLVSEQSDRQPIELQGLNSDEIVALVKTWLQEFYQENQHTPPHPLYPFNENKLSELGKGRPTIRAVLKWCAENFNNNPPVTQPPVTPPPTSKTQVEIYFEKELADVNESIDELLEDEVTISNALRLSFYTLIGETLGDVIIEALEEVEPKAANGGFMDFKIIGKVIGKRNKLKIGVDVVQKDGVAIGAALKKLNNYETFNLTRGCLVRTNVISPNATVAREQLGILLNKKKGGKWVALQSQDIQPLIAISWVYWGCEDYGITEEKEILDFQNQVLDFIKEKKIAMNNPLIREIISPPSYDILVDDEFPIAIPKPMDNAE
ncbi:hypothetical protein MEO94_30305 [Dolichospermum sp. ST_sed9]|nr:hypothetical protein [Dolichospermum sp. ST_sed9]